MKKALTLLLLIVLAFTAACTTQTVVDDDNDADGVNNIVTERTVVRDEGDGRIVTAITGSASDQMLVTVDNIEIYSADKGWVTVAGDEDTYTLGSQRQLRLAGDQEVGADTYTQLRLDISSASVGGQDVEVPGEKFVVPIDLVVPAESTTAVVLDIHGDASLRYVDARYLFTPIVSVNTCVDATVMVNGEVVTTSCQQQPAIVTYEQDVTGRVVVNTVVREVPVIRVERVETTNTVTNNVTYNNTVIQREVIREQTGGPNTTGGQNTTTRTNTTANTTVNGTA